MSDNEPEDRELRKLEREYDHQEKRLEETNEMLKQAPSLLGEITQEVIIPLITSLPSPMQQEMWQPPPEEREKPEYDPQVDGVSSEKAEEMRDNLNLNGGDSG